MPNMIFKSFNPIEDRHDFFNVRLAAAGIKPSDKAFKLYSKIQDIVFDLVENTMTLRLTRGRVETHPLSFLDVLKAGKVTITNPSAAYDLFPSIVYPAMRTLQESGSEDERKCKLFWLACAALKPPVTAPRRMVNEAIRLGKMTFPFLNDVAIRDDLAASLRRIEQALIGGERGDIGSHILVADHQTAYLALHTTPIRRGKYKQFFVGVKIEPSRAELVAFMHIPDCRNYSKTSPAISEMIGNNKRLLPPEQFSGWPASGPSLSLIYQLCDGDMQSIAEERKWSTVEKYRACLKAAKAVRELHKMDCIHRDLKPSQFLVYGKDILLGDLDTVIHAKDASTSEFVGTFGYFPFNYGAASVENDMYAFGCTLERMFQNELKSERFPGAPDLKWMIRELKNESPEDRLDAETTVDCLSDILELLN